MRPAESTTPGNFPGSELLHEASKATETSRPPRDKTSLPFPPQLLVRVIFQNYLSSEVRPSNSALFALRPPPTPSLVTNRIDRIEACRLDCGIDAENQPHRDRYKKRQKNGSRRHNRRPSRQPGNQ